MSKQPFPHLNKIAVFLYQSSFFLFFSCRFHATCKSVFTSNHLREYRNAKSDHCSLLLIIWQTVHVVRPTKRPLPFIHDPVNSFHPSFHPFHLWFANPNSRYRARLENSNKTVNSPKRLNVCTETDIKDTSRLQDSWTTSQKGTMGIRRGSHGNMTALNEQCEVAILLHKTPEAFLRRHADRESRNGPRRRLRMRRLA